MAHTNDLLGIITLEHALHPRMVLSDLQKLIYQSVFGGDHLLENPARFADGVRHEWVGFDPPPAEAGPALQPIDPDGRTARIHLAVCKQRGVEVDGLIDCLLGQGLKQGRDVRYAQRWAEAIELARANKIPFFVEHLEAAGTPDSTPHHSPSYGPASYRIVHDITDPRMLAGLRDLGVLG